MMGFRAVGAGPWKYGRILDKVYCGLKYGTVEIWDLEIVLSLLSAQASILGEIVQVLVALLGIGRSNLLHAVSLQHLGPA